MVITVEHLRQTRELTDRFKSGLELADYLFTKFLPLYADRSFVDRIVKQVARVDHSKLNRQLANELYAQAVVIVWILVPIQLAYGCLPQVTSSHFRSYLENEPRTNWDEFYAQFTSHLVLWGDIVKDFLNRMKDPTSRIIVGRIVKMFLDRLPEPLTA